MGGKLELHRLVTPFAQAAGGDPGDNWQDEATYQANSGLNAAITNTIDDDYTMSPGEILTNTRITGFVYLGAVGSGGEFIEGVQGCKLVNCELQGGWGYNATTGGNYSYPVARGVIIEHCTGPGFYSLGGGDIEVGYTEIVGSNDTFMVLSDFTDGSHPHVMDNVYVHDGYHHGMTHRDAVGAHLELLHAMGVTGLRWENNWDYFLAPDATTAAQLTAVWNISRSPTSNTPCTDCHMLRNKLASGVYPALYLVYLGMEGAGNEVKDNDFNHDGEDVTVQYPMQAGWQFDGSGNTNNGSPITLDEAA